MLLDKANKYLLSQGFPKKYVNLGLSNSSPFKTQFVNWQMTINDERPVTFLCSKNIDNLYLFSTCAARLFYLNNFTSEIINSNHIAEGYFGKAFFIIVEDAYALNVSHKDNLKKLITEKIKVNKPILFQMITHKDFNFIGQDFLESIAKNVVVVGV